MSKRIPCKVHKIDKILKGDMRLFTTTACGLLACSFLRANLSRSWKKITCQHCLEKV